MRRILVPALLAILLPWSGADAQILDETMVPRGQLRLQAHPSFTTWDSRFGRDANGQERRERLGSDLTDSTGIALFPGIATLAQLLGNLTGVPDYRPALGATAGRVTQDVERIDFGGHIGVFDWLTIGAVLPWMRTRTALDLAFTPDTVGGADLGLSPAITNPLDVNGYLSALGSASAAAASNAAAVCGSGPTPECSAAQALADRAGGLLGSLGGAYAASPFFPLAGSAMSTSLAQLSSALDADLVAAGLPGLSSSPAFAAQSLAEGDLATMPARAGAGISGARLATRTGLWQTGDVELSALVRVLRRGPTFDADRPTLSYRVSLGFLARLPTGTPEDPDIFLDIGTGDGQADLEGRVIGALEYGRVGLAAGGRYGSQGATTLTKRVAPPEVVMPPVATRQAVRWHPASYLHIEVVPSLRLTEQLSLTGEYRFFHKGGDRYELVDPTSALDPTELALETSATAHQLGVGLRYTTVEAWAAGLAPRPMELHLRLITTRAGSGGQVPVATRVEVGVRLFRRFWGPNP